MDRYNHELARFAKTLREQEGRPIYHLDCRGAVPDRRWRDAMHPDDNGFWPPAFLIHKQIKQLQRDRVIRQPR